MDGGLTVGVMLAILVDQKDLRFKALIRTVLILPWAVLGFVTILAALGIEPKAWLTDPFWTKTALIMMQTWLGFPFIFAMTTGVLQAIPNDLYEAATMDGASTWKKLKTITLPLVLYSIAPIIITNTPLTLITSILSICLITVARQWPVLMQAERIFWCRGYINSPCHLRNMP